MTDLAPDFDFQASSRAAEEAALAAEAEAAEPVEAVEEQPVQQQLVEGEPEVEVEAEAEAPATERRRDPETGQFLPNEPAEPEFYAGRYKTREEAERGIAEAQAAAQRAQAERDQAAQRAAEYEAMLRQQQEAAQRPHLPPNFSDLVDDNPAYAAQLAYQAGDRYAFQQAAQAWDELSPGSPALFVQNAQLAERLAEVERNTQAQLAPALQQHAEQERRAHIARFDQENPWFKEIPNEELIAVVEDNPSLGVALTNPQNYEEYTRNLAIAGYEALRRRTAVNEQVQSKIQDVARTQATEAQRAREDAFVASSQTATAQEPASLAELEQQRSEQLFSARQDKWASGLEYGAPRN